jgi:hypothetical protein
VRKWLLSAWTLPRRNPVKEIRADKAALRGSGKTQALNDRIHCLIRAAKGNRHGQRDATMILIGLRHGLLEARILAALKSPGRTEGVRKIAKRFGVHPGTVQRISHPFDDDGLGATADHRNCYKVEKWTKAGRVERMLYAGKNLDNAREIFDRAIKHRPRIRLTIHVAILSGLNYGVASESVALTSFLSAGS